jgi:hypothetical protein
LRTLATANSKSSCVTCCLRSRRAYMPGPTQYKYKLEVMRGHTSFCTYTAHLRTRTLAHLLGKSTEVDTALERHLVKCRHLAEVQRFRRTETGITFRE